jgi:hypothetical protein
MRRFSVIVFVVVGCIALTASARAADAPEVAPADTVAISVAIPIVDHPSGTVRYTVEPASEVTVKGTRTGTLTWKSVRDEVPSLRVRLTIPPNQPSGPFVAARVALDWANGKREWINVPVVVVPKPGAETKSSKDFLVVLTPGTATAAAGGNVTLRYNVLSNEETEERIRLRFEAAPGWTLLDTAAEQQERVLEAFQGIEGELTIRLPEDAEVGKRQLVRLVVLFVDEPGELDARAFVSVAKHGNKAGVPAISGTWTAGLSRVDTGGLDDAQKTGAISLATKFNAKSTVSFSYDDGRRAENLSNFRYVEDQRMRVTTTLRYEGWEFNLGNSISSTGDALVGPYVFGRGVAARRTTGKLITELVVAEPSTFLAAPNGHVLRGRVGARTPRTAIAFVFSDFGRRDGAYTTLSTVQPLVLDQDSQEELEIERQITAPSTTSNVVRGLGVDAEFRPARPHRVVLRAGGLSLANAAGAAVTGPSAEASYSYSQRQKTFTARWRQVPPTVQGVSIPRDELAVDGSMRVFGGTALVGRTYQNSSHLIARDFYWRGTGASLGLRSAWKSGTVELRGNYRESTFSTRSIRRTATLLFAKPFGPFELNGSADIGQSEDARRSGPIAFYTGELRWGKDASTISLSASHSEGVGQVSQRADLLASLRVHAIELAGGAWGTRGYVAGGTPGAWASVGVPVPGGRLLTLGIEYSSLTWLSEPSLRGTVTIRQPINFPVPFVSAKREVAPRDAEAPSGPAARRN